MDLKKSKQLIIILAVVYCLFAVGIYAVSYERFHSEPVSGSAPNAEFVIGEVIDDTPVTENIIAPCDKIKSLSIMSGTYDRENSGEITVKIYNSENEELAAKTLAASEFVNNGYTDVVFDSEIAAVPGEILTVEISSSGSESGSAVTFYAGNLMDTAESFAVAGNETQGTLCIKLSGYNHISFYITYIVAVTVLFVILAIYTAHCWKKAKKGISSPLVSLCTVYTKYNFLIKQLVSRDIKTKYKRSALGMAWSIMNPLLSMSVQYVVFSTLFRSDIPNYPVYLLTGIVFFNFFTEALTMGMTAITSNASLIKKVYMPKYIYPVTRVISSLVNFACALVPLFLMMIITGTPLRPALLLLFYDILCYLAFIIGLTLLLTTAMTFFQDTQFLWGIVSMMWQYITPVFYPETIIPESFLPVYRLNPMYQYISFARTCIIDGASPSPEAYVMCLVSSVAVLLIGVAVFKKHQNKFVLYL